MSQSHNYAAIAAAALDYLNATPDEVEYATALCELLGSIAHIDGSGYPVPGTVRHGSALGIRSWLHDYAVDTGWVPSYYPWASDVVFGGGPAATHSRTAMFNASLTVLHHLVNPTQWSMATAVECMALLEGLTV